MIHAEPKDYQMDGRAGQAKVYHLPGFRMVTIGMNDTTFYNFTPETAAELAQLLLLASAGVPTDFPTNQPTASEPKAG